MQLKICLNVSNIVLLFYNPQSTRTLPGTPSHRGTWYVVTGLYGGQWDAVPWSLPWQDWIWCGEYCTDTLNITTCILILLMHCLSLLVKYSYVKYCVFLQVQSILLTLGMPAQSVLDAGQTTCSFFTQDNDTWRFKVWTNIWVITLSLKCQSGHSLYVILSDHKLKCSFLYFPDTRGVSQTTGGWGRRWRALGWYLLTRRSVLLPVWRWLGLHGPVEANASSGPRGEDNTWPGVEPSLHHHVPPMTVSLSVCRLCLELHACDDVSMNCEILICTCTKTGILFYASIQSRCKCFSTCRWSIHAYFYFYFDHAPYMSIYLTFYILHNGIALYSFDRAL